MLQSYAGVILEKIDAKCNEIFLFKTGEEKGKLPLGFFIHRVRFENKRLPFQIHRGQVGIRKQKILLYPPPSTRACVLK